MSIELVGVRNTGIKITDSLTIPVIKLIVNLSGSTSAADMQSFYSSTFERIKNLGMVAAVAYSFTSSFHGDSTNPANAANTIPDGTVTYGGTSGFKISIRVRRQVSNWPKQVSDIHLWFNNQNVCVCTSYTGYGSPMEARFLAIIVDANDNIYRLPSFGDGGIYVATNGSLFSITNVDNTFITGIVTGTQAVFTSSALPAPDTLLGSISNYITAETDPEDHDPYARGGTSDTGGGTGDFDGTSDNVGIPSLPTLSAVETGFITLFNPTLSELQALANYMWGSLFDLDNWKKLFADPMDAILGMSIVPVAVTDAGTGPVMVGNINTGINMTRAASQYVSVDCGTLNVNEYWGAYLDYDPYTKAEIYLPYIGTKPLATDDIMGKAVHVVYHIDVLSGGCTAFVQCGNSVLYEYIGHCSSSIPITGRDWTEVVNGVLNIAGSLGTAAAGAASGNPAAVASGVINAASSAINITKPIIERSGSMSGAAGMLGIQKPYIILTRPRQCRPAKQNVYTAYPSFITRKLANVHGLTQIYKIRLQNVPATQEELTEITSLLTEGVIL